MRHKRVRAKLSGTAERPRLAAFASGKHMHLQLIDDVTGKTLAAASTLEVKEKLGKTTKAAVAAKLLAGKAAKLGIKTAVFDRGGFLYHGRIKAVADALREAGLKV